jgi:hypothetical protein
VSTGTEVGVGHATTGKDLGSVPAATGYDEVYLRHMGWTFADAERSALATGAKSSSPDGLTAAARQPGSEDLVNSC